MSGIRHKYYKSHYDLVNQWCRNFTRNESDADDLTQEVFIKFSMLSDEKLEGFKNDDAVTKFLFVTTRNHYVDDFRKKKGRTKTVPFEEASRAELSIHSETQDDLQSKEIWMHNEEYIYNNIEQYIPNNTNRFIYIQRCSHECSYKEIMDKLLEMGIDIKEETIRQRMSRTRRELKQLLEKKHPNYLTKKNNSEMNDKVSRVKVLDRTKMMLYWMRQLATVYWEYRRARNEHRNKDLFHDVAEEFYESAIRGSLNFASLLFHLIGKFWIRQENYLKSFKVLTLSIWADSTNSKA